MLFSIPWFIYNDFVINPEFITSISLIFMLYASSFLFVVADTLTVCFALNKLVMLSAFSVLFLCSSSIITINFIPLFCACSILSYKLLFSSSLNAVFPFLVTFSQFIKAVSCSSNPVVNTSFNVFVVLFFSSWFILFLLCSSSSPEPGVNHTNT